MRLLHRLSHFTAQHRHPRSIHAIDIPAFIAHRYRQPSSHVPVTPAVHAIHASLSATHSRTMPRFITHIDAGASATPSTGGAVDVGDGVTREPANVCKRPKLTSPKLPRFRRRFKNLPQFYTFLFGRQRRTISRHISIAIRQGLRRSTASLS